MKYLVKNTVTGEETICEKVVVDGEDYYILSNDVEKEEPPCYCYNSIKNTWKEDIILYQGAMHMYHYVGFKKIIATTNKSLGLPMVIDEVDYYSVIEQIATSTQPSNNSELSIWHEIVMKMCSDAISAPKETYQFTKDDMVGFTEWLITKSFREGTSDYTTSELFDIWQEQRTIEILVK